MMMVPLALQGATQFDQGSIKGPTCFPQGLYRFSESLHRRIANLSGNRPLPFDEFRHMAVVVLYPMRQKDPQFLNI